MAGRADGSSGPESLGCPCRRAFGGSAVHLELCLGFAQQWAAGLRRGAAGGHLRLLSACLSARGRRAARPRSGAGGDGAFAGLRRVGMLCSRRGAATAACSLRRHVAGRPRHVDRVRRLRAFAISHLHDRTLRSVQDRPGRAGIIAVGAGAHRSVSGLRGRRTECARPCALRARWLRRPPHRRARAPGADPVAGASGVRGADKRDARRAAGHDRLLAAATRSGRHVAGRAIFAASLQRNIRFRQLRTGRSGCGRRPGGAARLSHDALPEPPVRNSRADRLSRTGRAGHRRSAGVHFAHDRDDPPALSERRAAGRRLRDPVPAVRSGRRPLGVGAGPTRNSRKRLARSGWVGSG